MLARVRGVEGVAQLVDEPRYRGRSCWTTPALWRGSTAVGVIHRDVSPGNIVLSPESTPCRVDFSLANAFAEIRPEFTRHRGIVGKLTYPAPEQTGRAGRSVDQR